MSIDKEPSGFNSRSKFPGETPTSTMTETPKMIFPTPTPSETPTITLMPTRTPETTVHCFSTLDTETLRPDYEIIERTPRPRITPVAGAILPEVVTPTSTNTETLETVFQTPTSTGVPTLTTTPTETPSY